MSGITIRSVGTVPKTFEEQVVPIEPVGNRTAAFQTSEVSNRAVPSPTFEPVGNRTVVSQPSTAGHRNLYPIFIRYRFLIFLYTVSLITIGTCVYLGGYWVLGGVIAIVATMAFESIGLAWSAKILADKLVQLNKALAEVGKAPPFDKQRATDKAEKLQEDVAAYINLHANSYVWQKAFATLLKNTHYHFVQDALQKIFNSRQFQKYYLATFGQYAVIAEGLVEGGHIFNLLRYACDTGNEQMLDNVFALTHVKEDLAGRDLEQFRYQLNYLLLDDPQELKNAVGNFTKWQKLKYVVRSWIKVDTEASKDASDIANLRRAIYHRNVKLFKNTLEKLDREVLHWERFPLEAFRHIKAVVDTGKATHASEIIQKGIEQAFLKQDTNGPLHRAFTRHNPNILTYLYQQQVVLEAFKEGALKMRNEKGQTPLHIAFSRGLRQVGLSNCKQLIVDALLIQDNDGNTCLHLANAEDDGEWLKSVLGIKIIFQCLQTKNKKGETPLHVICQNHKSHLLEAICQCLFFNRKNVLFFGGTDDSGNTPLHIICENNDLDMLRIICQCNHLRKEIREVVQMKDNMDLTPLDLATGDAKRMLKEFVQETFEEKVHRLGAQEAIEEEHREWLRKRGIS